MISFKINDPIMLSLTVFCIYLRTEKDFYKGVILPVFCDFLLLVTENSNLHRQEQAAVAGCQSRSRFPFSFLNIAD